MTDFPRELSGLFQAGEHAVPVIPNPIRRRYARRVLHGGEKAAAVSLRLETGTAL